MKKVALNLVRDDDSDGDDTHRRAAYAVTVLVVMLYVAVRLWRLDASCLWFDEIFSVHAARHEWDGLLSFVAADLIHPPLFYVLLKVWIGIGGESLYWLRLFPALTAVACVAPFVLLARELELRRTETNLALLLLAANGYLIKYAQELRMYSLLLFFTLGSLWLFVRFFNVAAVRRRELLALFVVNLLLVYTHYFGWLVVAAEIFFLLLKGHDRRRAFSVTVAALVLCFVPWMFAVLVASGEGSGGVGQNIGWMTRPRFSDVVEMLALLQQPFYFRQSSNEPLYARWGAALGFLLFAVPAALFVWRNLRRGVADETREARADATWWLLVCCFLPLALAFFASLVLPYSIWGTRHLIIVAAPYMMLAAVALCRLRPAWLRLSAHVLLGCWLFVAALGLIVRREGTYIWCAWGELAATMAEAETGADGRVKVYAFEDLVAYHLWFALDTTGEKRFDVEVVKHVPGIAEDPAYFLPRRFDGVAVRDASALAGERLWVAFRDASWDEARPPLKLLKERGYHAEKTFESEAQGQRAFLVLVRREAAR